MVVSGDGDGDGSSGLNLSGQKALAISGNNKIWLVSGHCAEEWSVEVGVNDEMFWG